MKSLEHQGRRKPPALFLDALEYDRDLYANYLNWKPSQTNRFKFMYTFDRIRSVSVKDLYGVLTDGVESSGALPAELSIGGQRFFEL